MNTNIKNNAVKVLRALSNAEVRLIISENNWLESSAVEQLKKTAELPGMRCVVGMPDLHPGKVQPIGAAFITQDKIYPHLVGSDIGCGMGLWTLDVKPKQVKLNKWEKQLTGLDGPWEYDDINKYLLDLNLGALGDELKGHDVNFGTIGGGNHFAEIQQVNEIFNNEILSDIGLSRQSIVLLAHSGSRGLGQDILRTHIDKYGAKALAKNNAGEMKHYLQLHDYAMRWAVINRELIAERFCKRLGVEKTVLLDVSHNMVRPLNEALAFALGLDVADNKNYWIHRKGASPTDQGLVMIPGSRGSLSYLVRPRTSATEDLARAGFSLAHGAGRKWQRRDAKARLEKRYRIKDLQVTELGSRVICKKRNLLYEEAPQAYKNIRLVIDDLVNAGVIDVVASFKPLITYKTREN